MELTVVYQPFQQEASHQETVEAVTVSTTATAAAATAAAEPKSDTEEQELLGKLSALSDQEDPTELPTGVCSCTCKRETG